MVRSWPSSAGDVPTANGRDKRHGGHRRLDFGYVAISRRLVQANDQSESTLSRPSIRAQADGQRMEFPPGSPPAPRFA